MLSYVLSTSNGSNIHNFTKLGNSLALKKYTLYLCFTGTIAVHTAGHIITQPFPTGQRATQSRTDPNELYRCDLCDPGAPTEQCFPELNIHVCAKLSDTAVAIIGTNGVWHSSISLDPNCLPRSLQKLTSNGLHLSVDCHNYTSQLASIKDTEITWYEHQGWFVQSEIVVEGTGFHGTTVYYVEIDGNLLFQSNFHSGLGPVDITPITDCSNFISLSPLYTRDKFLLWCDTNEAVKRLYVVDITGPNSTPHVASNSPPLSSPNGQTFVTLNNATLLAYRTDSLSVQPPGAREFSGRIVFHTYIDNNTLLVFVDGQNQILVNVDVFIDSSGTQGVFSLSSASISATLHKLMMHEVYVTCNTTGSLSYLLLFNTSDGRLLNTFPNFEEQVTDVFFQQGPNLPPPSSDSPSNFTSIVEMVSTSLQPSTTSALQSGPLPTILLPTSLQPSTTSALQSGPLPTILLPSATPTDDTTVSTTAMTATKSDTNTKVVFIVISIVVFLFLLVAVILLFTLMNLLPKWCRRRHTTGPFAQETTGNSSPMRWSRLTFNEQAPSRTSDSGSYDRPLKEPLPDSHG